MPVDGGVCMEEAFFREFTVCIRLLLTYSASQTTAAIVGRPALLADTLAEKRPLGEGGSSKL